jgi:hypothetical protein
MQGVAAELKTNNLDLQDQVAQVVVVLVKNEMAQEKLMEQQTQVVVLAEILIKELA